MDFDAAKPIELRKFPHLLLLHHQRHKRRGVTNQSAADADPFTAADSTADIPDDVHHQRLDRIHALRVHDFSTARQLQCTIERYASSTVPSLEPATGPC